MCDHSNLTPEEYEKRLNETVDKLVKYFRDKEIEGSPQKKETAPPPFKCTWEFNKDQRLDLERLFLKREEGAKTGNRKKTIPSRTKGHNERDRVFSRMAC